MATEKITVNLPPGFDPQRHLRALEKRISEQYGDGFEISSINPKKRIATASRQASITEVDDADEDSFEVRLQRGTKPADGEKIAIRLEEDYPGCEMTGFEPFLGKATLTKSSPETSRARSALSIALGVKPWDVKVHPRRDGGFDIVLPRSYVPSKHDDKLNEVATQVVGQDGWYVQTNAAKLTASIIPSDPPTFPGAIAYPFKGLGKAPRDQLMLGLTLGGAGEAVGEPLMLDFEAAPHSQISGTSGSGKALALQEIIPVPASHSFPNGWAVVKDLRAGDELYGKDGQIITLVGLSDTLLVENYDVCFSDGQTVRVGGEHLWRVSSGSQRNNAGQNSLTERGDTAGKARREQWAGDLKRYAAGLKPGMFAAARHIAEIAKCDELWVHNVVRQNDISVETVYETNTAGSRKKTMDVIHFAADEAFAALTEAGYGTALEPSEFVGEWRTARDIAFLTGIGNSKEAATKVRRRLRSRLVPEKSIEMVVESSPYERKIKVKTYPVAEVLDLLSENHLRNYSDGGIHDAKPYFSVVSTEEMAKHLTYEATGAVNWSVEVAGAITGPDADLPVDPYIFGAWLGDGDGAAGVIFQGEADSCTDEDLVTDQAHMISQIRAAGYTCNKFPSDDISVYVPGLLRGIKETGAFKNKHIPASYRRASYDQRLAVLQGLMDTDGTVDRTGSCELSLSDETLANDSLELIRSLGIKASKSIGPASYVNDDGVRVWCKDRHRIHFTTTTPVFRLPRKVARLPRTVRATQDRIYITDIKAAGKHLARCLRVDAPDGMYLTGGFIQTHNSVTLNTMITGVLAGGSELVIIDLPHKAVDFFWCKDLVRDGGWGCASLPAAVTAMTLVYKEGERRAKVLAEHGATKWTELPKGAEQFKPIFVLIDEVTGLIQLEDVPKGVPKDHPMVQEANQINLLKATLLAYMKKIAAEMRFVGIRMVLSSQVSSVNTGIPTALRMNLANKILLGANPTDNNRKLALSDPTSVPKVPENVRQDNKASRGVGVSEFEAQEPQVFKSFYAPTDDLKKSLEALGMRKSSRPEPTASEIARLTPSLEEDEGGSGGSHGGPDMGGPERAPSGKLASVLRKEMGDEQDWAFDENGKRLTGHALANATRHAAVTTDKPKRTPDQNNPFASGDA